MKKDFIFAAATAALLTLVGCNGTGTATNVGYSGRFIDSPVDGVTYTCGKVEKKTHDGGLFGPCPYDSNTKFSLGKLSLGEISPEAAKKNGYNVFIKDIVVKEEDAHKAAMLLLSFNQNSSDDSIALPENIDEIIDKMDLGSGNEELDLSKIETDKLQEAIVHVSDNFALNVKMKPVSINDVIAHLEESEARLETLTPIKQIGAQTGAE